MKKLATIPKPAKMIFKLSMLELNLIARPQLLLAVKEVD